MSVASCHLLLEVTHCYISRCVWAPGLLQSEDDACLCFCFLTHWNSCSWPTNLQQSKIQTASQTNWTHHAVSAQIIYKLWIFKLYYNAIIKYTTSVMFVNSVFIQNDSVLCEWPLGPVCQCGSGWWIQHSCTHAVTGQTTAGIWPSLPQSSFTCA